MVLGAAHTETCQANGVRTVGIDKARRLLIENMLAEVPTKEGV